MNLSPELSDTILQRSRWVTHPLRLGLDRIVKCIVPSRRDYEHRVITTELQMLHILHRVLPSERVDESPELFVDGLLVVRQPPGLEVTLEIRFQKSDRMHLRSSPGNGTKITEERRQ